MGLGRPIAPDDKPASKASRNTLPSELGWTFQKMDRDDQKTSFSIG
jgi:hypothetical protein